MDLFEKYLHKKNNEYIDEALTTNSYNNDEGHNAICNINLSTLGDSIIKMCLCYILYPKFRNGDNENYSKTKENYEKNEILGNVIWKYYHLEFKDPIKVSESTGNVPNSDHEKGTLIEAIIGAMYMNKVSITKITKLIEKWIKIIDEENANK